MMWALRKKILSEIYFKNKFDSKSIWSYFPLIDYVIIEKTTHVHF